MSLSAALVYYVYNKLFVYQFCSTLLAYLAIKSCFYLRARKRRFELFAYYGIPGPKASLLDGHMRPSRENAAYFKFDEYCHAKFGKTFGLFMGDEPVLMTTDLELLRGVFLEKLGSFKERAMTLMKGPIEGSIFSAPYNRWNFTRRAISPTFSGYKLRNSDSTQFIGDSVKLLLEYVENKLDCKNFSSSAREKASVELDILNLMKALALHMISDMAICLPDVEVKENGHYVKSLNEVMSNDLIDVVRKYPFLKGTMEFIARNYHFSVVLDVINQCLSRAIDARFQKYKENPKIKDDESSTKLINRLIRLHYEGEMTREEVIFNCHAILLAGYDTTSTALTYILWMLAKYQPVQDELRADLMTYGTESKYLEQIINETLRLYPVVIAFATRLATETVTINDVTIPQGTKVVFNSWLVHRDPTIWPEPLKFDPNRFKPGTEHHPCAFAPFGLGARICPGMQLALLETKIAITDMLLRYKLDLVSPAQLELISYAVFLTKPKDTIKLKISKL